MLNRGSEQHRLRYVPCQIARYGIPCEICIYLGRLELLIEQADGRLYGVKSRHLPALQSEYKRIRESHPKCRSCGILFGGLHSETEFRDGCCQDCIKDWESACKRIGKDVSFEQSKKGLPLVVLRDSDLRMLREYAERLKQALHKTSP